jgi:hypothetical protein
MHVALRRAQGIVENESKNNGVRDFSIGDGRWKWARSVGPLVFQQENWTLDDLLLPCNPAQESWQYITRLQVDSGALQPLFPTATIPQAKPRCTFFLHGDHHTNTNNVLDHLENYKKQFHLQPTTHEFSMVVHIVKRVAGPSPLITEWLDILTC